MAWQTRQPDHLRLRRRTPPPGAPTRERPGGCRAPSRSGPWRRGGHGSGAGVRAPRRAPGSARRAAGTRRSCSPASVSMLGRRRRSCAAAGTAARRRGAPRRSARLTSSSSSSASRGSAQSGTTADTASSVEVAAEGPELTEDVLQVRVEHPVAPRHRGASASGAAPGSGSRPAASSRPDGQPVPQRCGTEDLHPRGRELDRQRQSVEQAADLHDVDQVVLGQGEDRDGPSGRARRTGWPPPPAPAPGPSRTVGRRDAGTPRPRAAVAGTWRECARPVPRPAPSTTPDAAGSCSRLSRTSSSRAVGEERDDVATGTGRSAGSPSVLGERRPHDLGRGDRLERHEVDAVGRLLAERARRPRSPAGSCRRRRARSASPPGAAAGQERAELPELRLAADEAGGRGGQVARPPRLRSGGNRCVQPVQRSAGTRRSGSGKSLSRCQPEVHDRGAVRQVRRRRSDGSPRSSRPGRRAPAPATRAARWTSRPT